MTQHRIDTAGDLATIATAPYQRLDARMRDIVDHGISVQENTNTMSALEYLRSHGIAARVIERVLLEPQRRRNFTRN